MTETSVVADIVAEKIAEATGWCALNSAHVYREGDRVGLARNASDRVLGWLCPACLRRSTP